MAVPAKARALLDAPTYRYLHGGMLVVLVIAFATSFESGRAGARLLGYPVEATDGSGHNFTAALPLVCDVVAALATFVHGRVRTDPEMRKLAAQFVLVPMILSWGANSVDHVTRAPAAVDWHPAGRAAWIVGVIVAAGICPVAVAGLLHFSAKFVEFEQRQAPAPGGPVEPPALNPESRPGRVDAPPPAPDVPTGEPTPAPVKPKRQRTAAQQQADEARKALHAGGDHSACKTATCRVVRERAAAPRVRAA